MIDAQRYFSQIVIPEIGLTGQQKIAKAKVAVIGAGGLGCPVLMYLVAAGVGEIKIIDFDVVEKKNLNRQVLYNESDIGLRKAEIATQKLLLNNPSVSITAHIEKLGQDNAFSLLNGIDIVVDCCDNLPGRISINEVTKRLSIPFVYGAVRRMEGQISVCNYKHGIGFEDIFSDMNVFEDEDNCSVTGIIGFASGIIGCLQAGEVIKIIIESEDVLKDEIIALDLLSLKLRKIKIKKIVV
jgi:sulfur-carrier protein adenylyltransferase/sulfurtransferase